MTEEITVLDNWAGNDETSHREIARQLLPKLKEEMSEEKYNVEFRADIKNAVLDGILLDLSNNLSGADWYGMGYETPGDFLDAKAVSDTIGEQAHRYFEHDQIGKSWDVIQVIFDYAEEYDLVERDE